MDGAIFYLIYIISFVDKFPTFNWYLEIGAESQPQVQPVFFGPVPYVFWIILHGQLCSCTRQKQLRLRKEWAKNWRTLQNITLTLCAVEARLPELGVLTLVNPWEIWPVAFFPVTSSLRAAFSLTSGILRAVIPPRRSSRPSSPASVMNCFALAPRVKYTNAQGHFA